MSPEELISVANSVLFAAIGRYLNEAETATLGGAIAKQTYEQIAATHGYSIGYIKQDVGPKLWKNLSQALGIKVSKTNFAAALAQYQSDTVVAPPPSPPPPSATFDRGEMPNPRNLVGRETELEQLQQWICPGGSLPNCRLVVVLGMGGIGKTTLTAALVLQLDTQFQFIIWRSLQNAPAFSDIVRAITSVISQNQAITSDALTLLDQLRSHRCLIVLDNLETLLDTARPGLFLPEHEDYASLIQLLAQTDYQSCLVLTSREKPAAIAALADQQNAVRTLQVEGLPSQIALTPRPSSPGQRSPEAPTD